jgi:hypothetical protein
MGIAAMGADRRPEANRGSFGAEGVVVNLEQIGLQQLDATGEGLIFHAASDTDSGIFPAVAGTWGAS